MNGNAPQRPVDYAEHAIITEILEGKFVIGSTLPAERELAGMLGITRPTLREALRRLERDGWLNIQQGKSTIVNDFWKEGGLNILAGIVRHSQILPTNFVPNLLQVRLDLAPTYTRLAIEKNALSVIAVLEKSSHLDDSAEAYAAYDWRLQHHLTVTSENHVYTLIFNSFAQFYEQLARRYFVPVESRRRSDDYYRELLAIAQNQDLPKAETVTRHIMQMSIELWKYATETTGELS